MRNSSWLLKKIVAMEWWPGHPPPLYTAHARLSGLNRARDSEWDNNESVWCTLWVGHWTGRPYSHIWLGMSIVIPSMKQKPIQLDLNLESNWFQVSLYGQPSAIIIFMVILLSIFIVCSWIIIIFLLPGILKKPAKNGVATPLATLATGKSIAAYYWWSRW